MFRAEPSAVSWRHVFQHHTAVCEPNFPIETFVQATTASSILVPCFSTPYAQVEAFL